MPSTRAGAVLVAAGMGKRMAPGVAAPKALIGLGGRPLAWHSLAVFEAEPRVGAVVLVVPPGLMDKFREELVERWNLQKVSAVVHGGRTRQESVRLGLEALEDGLDPILVHDAARPLVTAEIVSLCLEKVAACDACIPAIPISGTVKAVDEGTAVRETLDRTALWEAQTPQVFRSSVIREAHRLALERGFNGTDDSSLAEAMGISVRVVRGSPENIKVTWPVDLEVAQAILNRRACGE
jgi:2-C-methyl-D-erythritol 4-phosphate cytidylyltransferase